MAPLVLCVVAAGLVVTIGQVGFMFTTKPLELDFKKLSPLRGARNLVNRRAAVRLIMSLAKVGIIGLLAAVFIFLS